MKFKRTLRLKLSRLKFPTLRTLSGHVSYKCKKILVSIREDDNLPQKPLTKYIFMHLVSSHTVCMKLGHSKYVPKNKLLR